MVVLTPSWQSILVVIEHAASKISMPLNTKKIVCVVFNPCDRCKIICVGVLQFTLAGCKLQFVEHCRYLGHIIDRFFSDDKDIQKETKALCTRTSMLCRRFIICLLQVKLQEALLLQRNRATRYVS